MVSVQRLIDAVSPLLYGRFVVLLSWSIFLTSLTYHDNVLAIARPARLLVFAYGPCSPARVATRPRYAVSALQHLFPTLGQDITERQYGADCRLYISGQGINWPVIRDTMDEFVIAHTVRLCHR